GNTQPARKKRRVSTKSSKAKKTFYGAPSKMNTRAPASSKNPRTIPFVGMVRKSWRKEFDADDTMQLRVDHDWWSGFVDKIQDGDISEEDLAYLAEIEDDSAVDDNDA